MAINASAALGRRQGYHPCSLARAVRYLSLRMEDVVAVEVVTDTGERCYFVTWGRIQSAVDGSELEAIVLERAVKGWDTPGRPVSARLCLLLSEARDAPFFYEALVDFAARPRYESVDESDADRCARLDTAMRSGRELYYLGNPERAARLTRDVGEDQA